MLTLERLWKMYYKKRSKLVSKPIYQTTKWFSESFLAIEMKKIKVKMINIRIIFNIRN